MTKTILFALYNMSQKLMLLIQDFYGVGKTLIIGSMHKHVITAVMMVNVVSFSIELQEFQREEKPRMLTSLLKPCYHKSCT